jgi:hypothetical protein
MILTPGPPGEAHRHPNADEVVSKWPTPVSGEAMPVLHQVLNVPKPESQTLK